MEQFLLRSNEYNFGYQSAQPTESSVIELFLKHVNAFPQHPAIITPEKTINYLELAQRASSLAVCLAEMEIHSEKPVAILLPPGIENILCQLAILWVGGSCVPLDPSLPDSRLSFMLENVAVNLILTNNAAQRADLPGRQLMLENIAPMEGAIQQMPHCKLQRHHRSHILFTSGSVGRPKAVEIESRGIIRLVINTQYVTLSRSDRVAAIANPTFDASLFEIWGALLNGAAVVIIAKETVIDPWLFATALQQYSVSVMFITTALFNLVATTCPEAFRYINTLLVGGEVANRATLMKVLNSAPPRRLVAVYGPTECTVFALSCELHSAEVISDDVPIGLPIDNTCAWVLDDQKNPVAAGTIGNLYVGGDGVARGYWNQPQLNAQQFITFHSAADNQPQRLYHTGDLAWQRADGLFMFAGRRDNQIKIRGHRVELEEIEHQLLESELLQAAAVCVVKNSFAEPLLTGFIVPVSPNRFNKSEIEQWIKQRLPEYMLPRLTVVSSLPMTVSGKIDRQLLLAGIQEKHRLAPAADADMQHKQSVILRVWQEVLNAPDITLDDDFFQWGGNSLQAARVVIEASKKLGRRVSVQNLYDAPSPRRMALSLQQEEVGNSDDPCTIMRNDSRLPADIQPHASELPTRRKVVLLTGASGFLGAFLLRDLLLQPDTERVICLVRAASNPQARLRLKHNLQQYGLWQQAFDARIEALASDIAQPNLALDKVAYEHLAQQCDLIFHVAAHVNYIQPYSAHYAANVLGTLNILRLAVKGKTKPLHYVSTIAVFGPASLFSPVKRIYEGDELTPFLKGMQYASGYSQSQWVAEKLIWQARERGIPLAVYRPGFITGDSESGAGNSADFIARIIKGCIKMGASPLLFNQRDEFIPVNYVSAALIHISRDNINLAKAFHLVPPDPSQSVDFNAFFELINQCGYPLQPLSYTEWLARLETDQSADNPLTPLLPMLSEVVWRQKTRWELYENMPVYDARNMRLALENMTSPLFSPMNRQLLMRYLDYWRTTGILP